MAQIHEGDGSDPSRTFWSLTKIGITKFVNGYPVLLSEDSPDQRKLLMNLALCQGVGYILSLILNVGITYSDYYSYR